MPEDHRMKINESEKLNKYLYVAREIKKKKLWSMKVTDPNQNRSSWNNPQEHGKEIWWTGD